MNDKHVKNRTILVTGAGGGLGSGLAKNLIVDGYTHVCCQYRSRSVELEELEKVMLDHDMKLDDHCFHADLTDEQQVSELHRALRSKVDPVWAVINLAGSSSNSMSWKTPLDEFNNVIASNLTTTFLTCREFIPEMRAAGAGRIITSSSVIAFTGTIGAAHYCAAKAGIVGYTRALALELANKNITTNTLALGYFDAGLINQLTPELQEDIKKKTPLKRFGTSDELAALVRFLISDEGAFITGQVHHMNGGFHL